MLHLLLLMLFIQFPLMSTDIVINILSDEYLDTLTVTQANIPHTGKNAAISILSDGTNSYILKQDKSNKFDDTISRIKEVIVSAAGCSHTISIDKNWFIPHNVGQKVKIYKNKSATLHSLIPGKNISSNLPSFLPKNFRLSQRYRPYQYEYKHGFEIQYGLCDATIKSMGLHKDFPGIVALDTFFGNFDRDTDNIFYDEKTNSFYGIDQGAAFSGDLPFLPICAYYELCKLESTGYFVTCSAESIKGLRSYKDTLKLLCKNYTASNITTAFEKLIPLTFSIIDQKLKDKKDTYLKNLKFYIEQSHQLCLNIVDQIEVILKKIDKKI